MSSSYCSVVTSSRNKAPTVVYLPAMIIHKSAKPQSVLCPHICIKLIKKYILSTEQGDISKPKFSKYIIPIFSWFMHEGIIENMYARII